MRPGAPRLRSLYCFGLAFAAMAGLSLFTLEHLKYPLIEHVRQGGRLKGAVSVAIGLLRPADYVLLGALLVLVGCALWLEIRRHELSRALREAPSGHFHLLLVVLLAWFGHSYLHPGYLLGGDTGSHVARTALMRMGFEQGRLISWENYSYLGTPVMQFTGPLYFWATGLVDVLVRNPNLTTKLVLFALHLASGVFVYLFLLEKGFGRLAAAVGALAFAGSFARLHALLWKGLLPQAITLALLPLSFLLLEKVLAGSRPRGAWWASLTLVNAALIVNHQAMGLFAGLYLGLYALVRLLRAPDVRRPLAALGLSAALSAAISVFAVLPILLERQWVMMDDSPALLRWSWPDRAYLAKLLIWGNTGTGGYAAYLGISVVGLAVLGVCLVWRDRDRPGLRAFAATCALGAVLSLGLRGSHVKDIVFTLFFVSLLAAVGAQALLAWQRIGGWGPAIVLGLLLLDLVPPSVQPVARRDKDFFDDAARYLVTHNADGRILLTETVNGRLSASTGPGGPPLLYYPVQNLIGAHNLEATLVHNYVAAVIKLAEGDLRTRGQLSPDVRRLLSLLNVKRAVNVGASGMGFSRSVAGVVDEGPLGRVIPVAEASPVVFASRLVEVHPPAGLDKPMFWEEAFEQPSDRVRRLYAFVRSIPDIMGYRPESYSARAIAVRSLPPGPDARAPEGERGEARVVDYGVGLDTVTLTVWSDRFGYAQLSHPWYPGLCVTHNGREVNAIQGTLGFMVLPVAPGVNAYAVRPIHSPVRIWTGVFSLLSLIVVALVGLGAITAPTAVSPAADAVVRSRGWAQFACFTGVGATGTLAHYATLIALVEVAGLNAVAGSGAGFVVGALVNYALNYHLTFRSRLSHFFAAPRFFTVALSGLVLNTTIMVVVHRALGQHYLVAQVFASVVVLVWNFLLNRTWTFRGGCYAEPR